MNKMYLATRAKELYKIECLNADEIAKRLGISRRTVFNWVKKFDWKKPPPKPLQLWELQIAATAMLQSLKEDTDGKYNDKTIKEMFKFFDYVLEEEKKEAKRKKDNPAPKGLTPERIKEIQRNCLGMDV
jgi:transposase